MNHFFFSYKSNDVFLVRPIAERLKAEGISVWIDEYGISNKDRESFQKIINDAIDTSIYGVLFVNDLYADSPWCLIEVERLLRKRPLSKIIVLVLKQSEKFKLLYSNLYSSGFETGYSHDKIFDCFFEKKAIKHIPKPIQYAIHSGEHRWFSKDAVFNFDNTCWNIDVRRLFTGLGANEPLQINHESRTDFTEFVAEINNQEIRLLLDYDFYEKTSESIMRRIETDEIKEESYEQDDRKRLKEEIEYFDKEVKNAYIRVVRSKDFYKGKINIEEFTVPGYEHIGTHLFSTQDRRKIFKHRLFSFRVPNDNLIFRVYKLVLPHPQFAFPNHKTPIRIRFIFCFKNDLKAFFASIPWCDHLVNSFKWTTTIPIDELKI